MKKVIIVVGIVLVAAGLTFWLTGDQEQNGTENELTGEVKEFEIKGGNYYFTTDEMRVNKGDVVRVTFSSEDGFHDFVLDEFGVATNRYRPEDEGETIEFVADKTGEFEYYCSVGDHREKGQVGKLIVE